MQKVVSRFLPRVVWVSSILCMGCASYNNYYRPLEGTERTPYGVMGATFHVPSPQNRSFVRVLALGFRSLRDYPESKVLSIRFFIENTESRDPWSLDTQNQNLILEGQTGSIRALGGGQNRTKHVLEIQSGHTQVVDLFFPMPTGITGYSSLKSFTLNWEIQLPREGRVLSYSTRFVLSRISSEKDPSNHGIAPEAQPIYWIR